MDVLTGLASFGAYLDTKEVVEENVDYGTTIKRDPINGLNVYDNWAYPEYKAYVADVAYKRYKEAENPRKSGLIPNFYNQMQEVARRNAEYRDEILKREDAKEKVTLVKQKENIDSRNLKYVNIFLYGFLPLMLLIIFVWWTM